jgi:endonuclease/exonuclease/phosphatase family metal-dependent hydrolase
MNHLVRHILFFDLKADRTLGGLQGRALLDKAAPMLQLTLRPCLSALMVFALLLSAVIPGWSAGRNSASAPELTVATFNLRFASDKSPNSWPERRPVMRACFKALDADVVGTQEGVYAQLRDIAADSPDYDWIGLGRDGGSRGEFMAIFYRRARLEPVAFDHYWLSDTPHVIASTNWGNTNRRMTTWARFRERRTGREFVVINTHLDHALVSARGKGAALIRARAAAFTNTLPFLLIGDFNAEPNDSEKTYGILTGDGFTTDVWRSAGTVRNAEIQTFHNFKGPSPGPYRIDWILTRGPWEAREADVFIFSRKGQFPSDHHPVRAKLRLN